MLAAVQIEGEHDAVGFIDLLATGAGQEGADLAVAGPVAHHHLVADPFEEGAVELAPDPRRHVDQDHSLGTTHRPTSLYRFLLNVLAARVAW